MATVRRYRNTRLSVSDGDSPDKNLYSAANRPSSQNPNRVAISVTVVASFPRSEPMPTGNANGRYGAILLKKYGRLDKNVHNLL
jgi:hypothetical protein